MVRKRVSRSEWESTIQEQARKCETFDGVVCVNVSGGSGSAVAWYRCLEWYGADRVRPVFADTNNEDEDLYRFIEDCEEAFGQKCDRLTNDGRDIWDVFDETGVLRIAKAGGACKASIELKQKPLDQHFKEVGADAVAVGIEFMEPERMIRFDEKLPTTVLFPLAVSPLLGECDIHDEIRRLGITPPRTYDDGHGHNNCLKTGCILAGVNQWAAIYRLNPDGFKYAEQREAVFTERTGFTVLRDQSQGMVRPYSLAQLRADIEAGKRFSNDWKSQCSCMEPQLFTTEECFGMEAG